MSYHSRFATSLALLKSKQSNNLLFNLNPEEIDKNLNPLEKMKEGDFPDEVVLPSPVAEQDGDEQFHDVDSKRTSSLSLISDTEDEILPTELDTAVNEVVVDDHRVDEDPVEDHLSCLDPIEGHPENGNLVEEHPANDPGEDHQTQTSKVEFQDAEMCTAADSDGNNRRQKMMDLVMTVNTGIDIGSEEQKRKSVRIKGIMKSGRSETPNSVHSSGSLTSLTEETIRRRAIQERMILPQTFAQVEADYGFPSKISISGLIGNLVPSKWASLLDSSESGAKEEIPSHPNNVMSEGGEGSSLIDTAYNFLSAGLKLASSFIGDESELKPREDTVRYNGYKIKVFGRRLLLESVHVNCDFNIGSDSGDAAAHDSSSTYLRPHTLSRESLEQSCEGRRVRIVVRLTGPSIYKLEEINSIMELEHSVQHAEGKWTLVYGNQRSYGENFIEICCPTGVHPQSLAYGFYSGLILIDAP